MDRYDIDLRNARRYSPGERSVLAQLERFVEELDTQLERLRADTRDEWHDLRRFVVRTRRELDRLARRSDRPVTKITEGARELGRELKKTLGRLSC